jgi:hypothetical protein
LLVLGGLLHFHSIIDDKIHEFIKTLCYISGEQLVKRLHPGTNPDFSFNPDCQLLVQPNRHS